MDRSHRRRVAIVAVASVVAVTCIVLGFWQLARLAERRDLNARILDRRGGSPVSIEGTDGVADEYRLVTVDGTYDAAHEVLVYGRSLESEAGHHVVTPLVLTDGDAVLVLRGWVPFAMQSAPIAGAAPPDGEVHVRGMLVPDEGDGSTMPDGAGVVRRLDVAGIASTLPYDVLPLPLQLTEQTPARSRDLPVPVPLPVLSEGPHLSYAIQWFSFAAVAAAGAMILLRRDRQDPRSAFTGAP